MKLLIAVLLSVLVAAIAFVGFSHLRKIRFLEEKQAVQGIALGYHTFHADHGRPPMNQEEFFSHKEHFSYPGNETPEEHLRRWKNLLDSGRYTVAWGMPLHRSFDRTTVAQVLLIYEKDPAKPNILVSFLDASTKQISRLEFESLVGCDEILDFIKNNPPNKLNKNLVEHLIEGRKTGRF